MLAGRNVWSDRLLASVVFSIHDRGVLRRLPDSVELLPFPVYASVMDDLYEGYGPLVEWLRRRGFAGLTVVQDARGAGEFGEGRLPVGDYGGFSVRLNPRGRCLDDTLMLLPDLTAIKSFRPYL